MVAAAVAGSAVAGIASSAVGSMGAQSAAGKQAGAEKQAAELEYQNAQLTRQQLQPYSDWGQGYIPQVDQAYQNSQGYLKTAFDNAQGAIPQPMTEDQLVKTPGYQFALSQGSKAMLNSEAAKGLGLSGNAIRSIGTYATGLADQTYKDQFAIQQQLYQDQNQQFSNAYNRANALYNQAYQPVSLGENAAAQAGNVSQSGINAAGANLAGAGQAQAAGIGASTQAITGGLNTLGSLPMTAMLLNKVAGNGSGTMGGAGTFGSSNATDPYSGMSGISQGVQDSIASSAASAPAYVANSGLGALY